MSLNYSVQCHQAGGNLYIDGGSGAEDRNRQVFECLLAGRDQIEEKFGGDLEWTPPNGRRSARVGFTLESGGYRDRDRWPTIYEATVDARERVLGWADANPRSGL